MTLDEIHANDNLYKSHWQENPKNRLQGADQSNFRELNYLQVSYRISGFPAETLPQVLQGSITPTIATERILLLE